MFENKKYKIVFIDDEISTLAFLKCAVDWGELQVEVCGSAQDGETGLELIKKVRPDIIIADICMPKCNGIELLTKVRQLGINCKVVLLSAYADFEYAQKAIKLNVTEYLLKPIDENKLKERIEEIVGELNQHKSTAEKLFCEGREHLLKNILLSEKEENGSLQFFRSMCGDLDSFISLVIQDDSYVSNVEFLYEQLTHLLKELFPRAVFLVWKNMEIKGVICWENWKEHQLELKFKAERLHVKILLGATTIKGKSVKQADWEACQARYYAFYSEKKEEWFCGECFSNVPAVSFQQYQMEISEYCIRQDWEGLKKYVLTILESEYERKLVPDQLLDLAFDFFICIKLEITKMYPEKTMNVLRHISRRDFEGAKTQKALKNRLLNTLQSVCVKMEEDSEGEKGYAIVRKAKEYTAAHYQESSLRGG